MLATNSHVIVRIAELEIHPDRLELYKNLLKVAIKAAMEREPGVLALYATSVRDSPASIRIFEIYADQQAYELHLQSPHFTKYKELTATMVASLRLVETEPLILQSKYSGWTRP